MNGFYTWYRVDVVVTQMDVRGGPEITIYFHNKVIRLLRQYSAVNVERVGDYAKQMALNDSTVFRERKHSSECRVTGRETGHMGRRLVDVWGSEWTLFVAGVGRGRERGRRT